MDSYALLLLVCFALQFFGPISLWSAICSDTTLNSPPIAKKSLSRYLNKLTLMIIRSILAMKKMPLLKNSWQNIKGSNFTIISTMPGINYMPTFRKFFSLNPLQRKLATSSQKQIICQLKIGQDKIAQNNKAKMI